MFKILLATKKPFSQQAEQEATKIVNTHGGQCQVLKNYTTEQELLYAVRDIDGLIIRSDDINQKVIEAGQSLKLIVRAGSGYDNIDLETATNKGILVMNTPGQNANGVAEMVVGMMIQIARKNYTAKSGFEVTGRTIGIQGFGNIGRIVAQIAKKGFKMNINIFDPYVSAEDVENLGYNYFGSIEDFYKESQIITLHIPLTSSTKESINYNLLNMMPKNGILINTARKEVINEADLTRVLEEREDFGYGADVCTDNYQELRGLYPERVSFNKKKCGAQTEEANYNAVTAAANQTMNYLKDGLSVFVVNKK